MTIYCPAQTYAATREQPGETCENEVEQEGDLCPAHDEGDREDDYYDRLKDSRYDD